ncbi:barstar family protein [Dactylosporangium sp. AC04546]|uniref:barstar family protein n=1 Tax=Dactylosporangium sp. AC04546 TaxID=2862460 RepID=UPI001EDD0C53|nr:barstar family protein [Dactylosporangium sp. AC04546]WVK79885.1 barstar family protein [Dactylosporangium sp. AC04546]
MKKFAMRLDADPAPVVAAQDVADFFVGRYSFDDFNAFIDDVVPAVTFRLLGVRSLSGPDEPFAGPAAVLSPGDIEVEVLDNRSVVMGRYSFWAATVEIDTPARTWTVHARTQLPPHVGAAQVWERRRHAPPAGKGEWETIPVGLREGWVEVSTLLDAQRSTDAVRVSRSDDVVLEGRGILDVASFFCAVGEAFSGPGGYFGNNFTSLEECLDDQVSGRRVRLHWKDWAVAQRHLGEIVDTADGPMSQLDRITAILHRANVDVLAL